MVLMVLQNTLELKYEFKYVQISATRSEKGHSYRYFYFNKLPLRYKDVDNEVVRELLLIPYKGTIFEEIMHLDWIET